MGGKNASFPGISPARWYERSLIGTALREGPPLIAALVAALVATRELRTVAPDASSRDALYLLSFLSWVACVWLGVSSVVQIASALRADGRQKQFESPRDLAGCLHVLHALLQAKTRDRANGHSSPLVVRLTVYRVDGEELEQCIPYVGGKGGAAGRRMSIRTGVAGLVARTVEAHAAQRTNLDWAQFEIELVKDWNFTHADIEHISRDKFSWMAVPIPGDPTATGKPTALAVVYLDCTDATFFSAEVQELVTHACVGLASHVRERYLL